MKRFSLADFNRARNNIKTGIERVERLTALWKKLDAVADELVEAGYYETYFEIDDDSSYTVQDTFERLMSKIEVDIRNAKESANYATMELAHALFDAAEDYKECD